MTRRGEKTVLSLVGLAVAGLYAVVLMTNGVGAPTVSQTSQAETATRGMAVKKLDAVFNSLGYTLTDVATGDKDVPRVMLTSVPHGDGTVNTRKSVFLRAMLPLVLMENERLQADRERLLAIQRRLDADRAVSAEDQAWLADMERSYKVTPGAMDELLTRVDVIPPSLALAQAAEESGWGTSRFAREGNALYGQWTWKKDAGIVPQDRETGKSHRVKAFATLAQAVTAYMHNLNTHRAYRALRGLRALDRAAGLEPNGGNLVNGLTKYSERGEDYIRTLEIIISANKLHKLDHARLDPDSAPLVL